MKPPARTRPASILAGAPTTPLRAPGPRLASARPTAGRRGFTLIELMVVVMIVGIMATMAIPTIGMRLRERRSSEVAIRIAQLYRQARLRAMGRGSAVMVGYASGVFNVREAIRRPTAANLNCVGEPSSSCTAVGQWTAGQENVTYMTLGTFDTGIRAEYSEVSIKRAAPATASDLYLDVCFTPIGRAFQRTAANQTLAPMAGVATFAVDRGTGSVTRTVAVLPNGIARLTL